MVNWEKIREDFPVLQRKIKGKGIIYLDSACMALKPQPVIDAINYYYSSLGACGGRSAHYLGYETTELCEESRKEVARHINAKSTDEIIWTKNTTESINLIAHGLNLQENDEIATSGLEHHSGILPFHYATKKTHGKLIIVQPDARGIFDLENWQNAITPKTKIVSLVHTSNLTGTTAPLKEIIKIAHEQGALVLSDSAQFVPHHSLDVQDLNVDFVAFSIHKMGGPSGMGVLYGKKNLLDSLDCFMVGGNTIVDVEYDQNSNTIHPRYLPPPGKFEAGLQNYGGIIGTGATIKYLNSIGMTHIQTRTAKLLGYLYEKMSQIPKIEIIGPHSAEKRTSLISFIIQGIQSAQDIGTFLDNELEQHRIMIRAGAHCVNPFHYWLGISPMTGTARASLYYYNSLKDIDLLIEGLQKTVSLMT